MGRHAKVNPHHAFFANLIHIGTVMAQRKQASGEVS
jgi:hypothetical protein